MISAPKATPEKSICGDEDEEKSNKIDVNSKLLGDEKPSQDLNQTNETIELENEKTEAKKSFIQSKCL
jgi:hypothetical protein